MVGWMVCQAIVHTVIKYIKCSSVVDFFCPAL